MEANKNCSNCRYYCDPNPKVAVAKNMLDVRDKLRQDVNGTTAEPVGYCRRHPPVVQLVPGQPVTHNGQVIGMEMRPQSNFPPVRASMWCGEHEPDFGA